MNYEELTLTGTRAGTGNEVFGIDLGTTYSAIAWLDDNGRPETLANTERDLTTPSVVYFDPDETQVLVGKYAKEALDSEPERVVQEIKRSMRDKEQIENGGFTTPEGKYYSPIEISAIILKKLAGDAAVRTGSPVKKVIITCPAYFGSDGHEATRMAGEAAGLEVLKVINEPTAAAFAYGIRQDEAKTVVVYDLGGGTFDVTVLRIDPQAATPIITVATGGRSDLGGKNWDEALCQLLARKWRDATGEEVDILENSQFHEQLKAIAEDRKIQLSGRSSVRVTVAPPDMTSAQVTVTQEEFDEVTEELLDRSIMAMRETLEEAAQVEGVPADAFDYDALLCVGGSSLMPQVKRRLEAEFGKTPQLVNPHQCVAEGAAVYAGLMKVQVKVDPDETETTKPPVTIDVLSKSYGIKAKAKDENGNKTDVAYFFLLKNQPQDQAEHTTDIFRTDVKDMHSLEIHVLESDTGCWERNPPAPQEGDGRAPDGQIRRFPYDPDVMAEILGGEIILPPGCEAGERVEVTFRVDDNMVLRVSAVHQKSGERVELQCDGVQKYKPEPLSTDLIIT